MQKQLNELFKKIIFWSEACLIYFGFSLFNHQLDHAGNWLYLRFWMEAQQWQENFTLSYGLLPGSTTP